MQKKKPSANLQIAAEHKGIAEKSLQFKPGADVALLNAMLNTIIEEGLVDRQYIEKNTDGYLELKEHVKDFTPEEMSNICDIWGVFNETDACA